MPVRYEYVFELTSGDVFVARPPADLALRTITTGDRQVLAELMLDAYRNTIDYEGEEIVEALAEIDRYFSGVSGNQPMPEHSFALARGQRLESACIVSHWRERSCPAIGYVITVAGRKRLGLGGLVLARSMRELQLAGHREVRAIITEGNRASETLFLRVGFVRAQVKR